MKLNFKQIKPKNIEGENFKDEQGKDVVIDIAQDFGNFIYQNTGDLGMLEVAQEIYKKGEIEVTDKVRSEILLRLEAPNCPFLAVVKQELITKLNSDELGKS